MLVCLFFLFSVQVVVEALVELLAVFSDAKPGKLRCGHCVNRTTCYVLAREVLFVSVIYYILFKGSCVLKSSCSVYG